jgi:hypothetical protein
MADKKAIYKITLTSKEDVRRLLSATINQLRRGEVDQSTARALGYLANCLLTTLESLQKDEIEQRLNALEQAMQEKEGKNVDL